MTLNPKQILSIILVILGVLTASAAQLTELIGPVMTKVVVSSSTLLMSMLAGIQAILSTQTSLVRDVQAMPGVESILVNKNASQALATMAVNPAEAKIDIAPGAAPQVTQTAKGV